MLQTNVVCPEIQHPAELKLHVGPLMFHQAAISANGHAILMSFDQQKQNLVEFLRFRDGSTLKELSIGKGRIFWAAYPVELAEGTESAAALYSYVAGRIGIAPLFDLQAPVSPGVLIYPMVLEDSVLYIMSSETDDDVKVDLRDKVTGTRLSLDLRAQRAALALVGKRSHAIVAKYGF
jgi:hypothetical protein